MEKVKELLSKYKVFTTSDIKLLERIINDEAQLDKDYKNAKKTAAIEYNTAVLLMRLEDTRLWPVSKVGTYSGYKKQIKWFYYSIEMPEAIEKDPVTGRMKLNLSKNTKPTNIAEALNNMAEKAKEIVYTDVAPQVPLEKLLDLDLRISLFELIKLEDKDFDKHIEYLKQVRNVIKPTNLKKKNITINVVNGKRTKNITMQL